MNIINLTNITNISDLLAQQGTKTCVYPQYNAWIFLNIILLTIAILNDIFGLSEKLQIKSEDTQLSRTLNKYFMNLNDNIIGILFIINWLMFSIHLVMFYLIP